MISNKAQEGVFIGLFALGVLVAISLAVSFMGNRVTDLLQIQGQVMAGKQSYWLSYSGIEIVATEAAAIPVKVRLEIFDIMSSPNKLTVRMLSAFNLK